MPSIANAILGRQSLETEDSSPESTPLCGGSRQKPAVASAQVGPD
jgi:hypothetical protein